jgi:hypothetical protein
MPRSKADNELPRVQRHLTRQRDEMHADRFHAARGPLRSQDQAFHRRVEIHCDSHDRPPRSVHTKMGGRHFSAGQIVFHHRMRFFAHAAAFAMPTNERVARHRQTIGDDAEKFEATDIPKLLRWKRQRRRLDMRQLKLPQRLADGQKTVFRSIFAAIANPRARLGARAVAQIPPERCRRETPNAA